MAFCSDCRQSNPGSFCSYCGTKLVELHRNPNSEKSRPIVILFADLQNSSQYAQLHSLAESARALQQYHQVMTDAVLRHNGKVAQIGGDDFLAYFDYDQPGNTADIQAVRTALQALRAIKVANLSGGLSLAARIAVHRGEASIFQSASGEMQFGGPAANTAARLQAYAPSNGLLVSAPVGERINQAFLLEACGPYELKGVNTPLAAFHVGGAKHSGPAGSYPKTLTAFTGRGDELATLNTLAHNSESVKKLILVNGEPGIGKSRLVSEFVALDPANWLRVNCTEPNKATPYGAAIAVGEKLIREMLDREVGQQEWIEHATTLAPLSPVLPLLGADNDADPGASTSEVTPGDMADFLSLLIEVGPKSTCLWLDDAHWADHASVECLRQLQDRSKSSFTTSIFTARLEYEVKNESLLSLRKLKEADCLSLFSTLGLEPSNDELLAIVLEKTAGNPLYIEQYVYSLIDQGIAGATASGSSAKPAIPNSLNDILVDRIDALERGTTTLLHASVIGDRQDLHTHQLFSPSTSDEFQLDIAHLCDRQLIEIEGDRLQFRHGLIRDAVYGSISRQDAIGLHRKLAGFLEQESNLATPELIAEHWRLGEESVFAVIQYLNASTKHIERSLYRAGLDSLEKAESLLPTTSNSSWRTEKEYELLTLKGNALSVLEKYGSSARLELSKRTLALYQQANIGGIELLPLMYGRWTYYLARSDSRTTEWAKRITEASKVGDAQGIPDTSVTVNFVNGVNAFVSGNLVEGVKLLTRAYSAYSAEDHERYMQYYGEDHGLYSSVWLQWALIHRGAISEALAQCDISDRLSEKFGDPLSEMLALTFRQHVLADLYKSDEVIPLSDHIRQRAEECGLDYYNTMSTGIGGRARMLKGDFSQEKQAVDTVKSLGKNGNYLLRIMVHRDMARVHFNRNDPKSQLEEVSTCKKVLDSSFEGMYPADVDYLEGSAAELAGDTNTAISLYEKSVRTAKKQGSYYFEVQAATALMRLALKNNQIARAETIARELPKVNLSDNCLVYKALSASLKAIPATESGMLTQEGRL